MTAEEFAKKIPGLAPSEQILHDYCKREYENIDPTGWKNDITRILNYFTCYKKENVCMQTDPLFQLCECYYMDDVRNLTNIRFWGIEDLEENNPDFKYFSWGYIESPDQFVYNKETKEIAWDNEGIWYDMAENSEKFLDALIIMADIKEKFEITTMEEMDQWNKKQANKCSIVAGGEKYLPFYLTYFENLAPFGF